MNMDQVIARINALAKKAKSEGLTAEETAERDKLRRIYIDSVKANLTGQLDNTYILRPDGSKTKLQKKILRLHANVQLLSDFLIGIQGDFPEISEKESFLWENYGT